MTSKWHGEGEKILKTLFEIARAAGPSILFVDEVDALLSARKSEGEHEASRRFKTEFMTQVDGICTPSSPHYHQEQQEQQGNLLVIACTNTPWDIDSAVLRRFPRRIYIDLPDSQSRSVLLNILLKKAGSHSFSKSQKQKLVKRLEGYSGSDITSIASEASFGPLRSLGNLQKIRTANSDDIRPISYQDFQTALDEATKSTSQDLLARYHQWRKDQGLQ
jgi:SpoVK/Ycf46/Vps4 family AAA+-type ATPase